jgi:hypothetical protein
LANPCFPTKLHQQALDGLEASWCRIAVWYCLTQLHCLLKERSNINRQELAAAAAAAAVGAPMPPATSTGLAPLSSSESAAAISLLALAPHTPPSLPSPQPSPVQHGPDLEEPTLGQPVAGQTAVAAAMEQSAPMDTAGGPATPQASAEQCTGMHFNAMHHVSFSYFLWLFMPSAGGAAAVTSLLCVLGLTLCGRP